MEVDEFEEDELGNYSMEVLLLAVQATYCSNLFCYTGTDLQIPSQFITWEKEMDSITSLLFTMLLVINGC
eukprot:1386453-Ditylum_brightwellii.AAC.1